MTRDVSLLLVVVTIWAALPTAAQSPPSAKERDAPEGWVQAPSSKVNRALWECAGYGGSWIVGLQDGSVRIDELSERAPEKNPLPQFLKLSKEVIGSRSLFRTADGWLVGFDAGEFGGGLWWFSNEGDDNRKLLSENVHSILQTPNGVFVLVGLAHLSLNSGKIYQYTETAEQLKITYVADLGGSPEASTVDSDHRIVIATPKSVVAFDYSGNTRKLFTSGEDLTYPTSIIVDRNGDIFIAMRSFVLRLIPATNGGYRPQWLMSKQCQSFKIADRICTCSAPGLIDK
jgi:hypothetical protein